MDGQQPLSTNAVRLWAALKIDCACSPASALTDEKLADLIHLDKRVIIDAAGELLAAGILCLAGSAGRWLGSLEEARQYERSLRGRGLAVLHRRRLVRRAIRLHEAGRSPDDTGQMSLFPDREVCHA